MVTCEQIRQACRRAVGAQATRTRIDASRSHFQAAASITANRAHFSRVVSPRLPSLGGHSVEYHRSTHTFRQRRLRLSRELHARAKELHQRRYRASLQHLWPKLQAPRRIEASFAAPQLQKHRGASTPSPRHRQRSLSCRIPRRHTDRRATSPQQLLVYDGLGPQQSSQARRGHARQ